MVVIFYDLDSKEIKETQDNVLEPTMPADMNLEEKKEYYTSLNLGFVGVIYKPSVELYKNKVLLDAQGNFVGLQPK